MATIGTGQSVDVDLFEKSTECIDIPRNTSVYLMNAYLLTSFFSRMFVYTPNFRKEVLNIHSWASWHYHNARYLAEAICYAVCIHVFKEQIGFTPRWIRTFRTFPYWSLMCHQHVFVLIKEWTNQDLEEDKVVLLSRINIVFILV